MATGTRTKKSADTATTAAADAAPKRRRKGSGSTPASASVSAAASAAAEAGGSSGRRKTVTANAREAARAAAPEVIAEVRKRGLRGKFDLVSAFKPAGDQIEAIEQLVAGVQAGNKAQTLLGVTGSGKTFTMANVIARLNRPTMILSHNKTLAAQLYGEMREFFPHNAVEYFVSYYDYYQPEAYIAATDTYIEKDASVNEHIDQMRLSATKALMERRDTVVVCSVSAIYGLGEPETYLKMMLHISRGEQISQRDIVNRLAALQYTRNDVAFTRSCFRVRGDVIDIFPAESDGFAVRVELFDDEIERISRFDPLTGVVECELPRFTIFPKSHYVTPREILLHAVEQIKTDLNERCQYFLTQNKLLEEQRLRERTQYDIEMINEVGYCSGIENYSRYLTGRAPGSPPPCLFDYLPDDGLLIIDESHVTVPQIGAMYRGDRSRKENLVNFGFRLPSAFDNRPLQFDEFERMQPQTIYVSATPAEYETDKSDQVVEQLIRPTGLLDPEIEVRPATTQVDDVMSEIRVRAEAGERTLVTTLTKKMAEELTSYLSEHQLRVRYMHSDIDAVERMDIIRDLRLGVFDALIGINLLREGLDIPEVSLVAVLDADKEGFLRSARSLIQTVGRAARNVKGKAIFYADKITDAMQQTMTETARRRTIQHQYNEEHGITPTQIKKKVVDVMEAAIANSNVFKVPEEERALPEVSRRQWEEARGIDSLKGTRSTRSSRSRGAGHSAPMADHNVLSALSRADATPAAAVRAAAIAAVGGAAVGTGRTFSCQSLVARAVKSGPMAALMQLAQSAALSEAELLEFLVELRHVGLEIKAKDCVNEIERLKQEMLAFSRDLRFEEAAGLRDCIRLLERFLVLLPGREEE